VPAGIIRIPLAGLIVSALKAAEAVLKTLIHFLLFALLSLAFGLGTAYHFVENGFALVAPQAGPWKTWINAGSLAADPYTRAHVSRFGDLPITSASGLTFVAKTDSDGDDLSSDCEYEIVGRPLAAVWWSIALFDGDGQLIPNQAGRHAYNSQNLTVLPDGTQRIALASQARPGHWLPSGEDHDLTLILRMIRPLSLEQQRQGSAFENLPVIQRVKC
jgi:hypothetical protein